MFKAFSRSVGADLGTCTEYFHLTLLRRTVGVTDIREYEAGKLREHQKVVSQMR